MGGASGGARQSDRPAFSKARKKAGSLPSVGLNAATEIVVFSWRLPSRGRDGASCSRFLARSDSVAFANQADHAYVTQVATSANYKRREKRQEG